LSRARRTAPDGYEFSGNSRSVKYWAVPVPVVVLI
jgi:hypothetical protein